MAASIDDLIATVTAMSVQFTAVLNAINVQKSFIDNAGATAAGSVNAAAASAVAASGSATSAANSAAAAEDTASGVAGALSDAQTAADQALEALENISISLTAAQTAATNASNSAGTATTKATEAAGSAVAAAASAASITGAEANSAASAAAALASKNAAATSETNAASSQVAAAASAAAALASKNAAGASETAAAASAATSSANVVTTNADVVAANSAKILAQTGATTATTKAGEASTSATAAASSQTAAASSAGVATTKAGEASGSAAAAATSETNAADSAEQAEYWATVAHADQIAVDWNQTNPAAIDFIKNKPPLGTASPLDVASSGNATAGQVVKGDDARLSDARPINISGTSAGQTLRWSGSAWAPGAYGSAAELNVASSGNATTGQVVKGNDTRLSDARAIALTGLSAGQVPRWNGAAWAVGNYGTAAEMDVPPSGDALTTQVVKGDDTRLTNARAINFSGTLNGQVIQWNGSSWAPATLPPGLQNFVESLNSSTPNATVQVARFLANVSTTNGDAVFSSKGSGALIAQVPDNTTTGGNKRGVNAVDWQMSRTNAVSVASGQYSVVAGGQGNRASGSSSVVSGGSGNAASSPNAVVGGGENNQSTALYTCISGGSANVLSGAMSTCPGGHYATDRGLTGTKVWGGATNLGLGKAQKSDHLLQITTTDATPTVMTFDGLAVDGVSNTLILPNNSAYYINYKLLMRNRTTGDALVGFGKMLVRRAGAANTTTLLAPGGSGQVESDTGNTGSWTVTADTTLGGVTFTLTGGASRTLDCLAYLECLELAA